jgi:hypothetical protein
MCGNNKETLLSALLATMTFLAVLMTLLCHCGRSDNRIFDSLAKAKKSAAKKDTWIVVEFWRHG